MPTRGSRRRTLAAPALLLTFATTVIGCTDGSNPTPTTTVTPSIAATPSPTPGPTPTVPSPPARPAAMATNDEAGAVAAAQYFVVDLYNYAYATLDLTDWTTLSDPACDFCNSVKSDVEAQSTPTTFDANATQVESATGTTITEGSRYSATVVVEQPQEGASEASSRYEFYFAIAWADGWRMLAVDVTPLEQ